MLRSPLIVFNLPVQQKGLKEIPAHCYSFGKKKKKKHHAHREGKDPSRSLLHTRPRMLCAMFPPLSMHRTVLGPPVNARRTHARIRTYTRGVSGAEKFAFSEFGGSVRGAHAWLCLAGSRGEGTSYSLFSDARPASCERPPRACCGRHRQRKYEMLGGGRSGARPRADGRLAQTCSWAQR